MAQKHGLTVVLQVHNILIVVYATLVYFVVKMPSKSSELTSKSTIKKKEKELMETREKILQLNDAVASISTRLKEKRQSEKSIRVANSRIASHTTTLALDFSKRPPDRSADIRSYSKMDMDCWQYDQLRDWFNTYAPEKEDRYEFNPVKAGYTVQID